MAAPSKLALTVALAAVLLSWDNPNPPGVVESFNVYWRYEASGGKWTLLTNVTGTCVKVPLYGDHGVFTVTSSNAFGETWMVLTNEVPH